MDAQASASGGSNQRRLSPAVEAGMAATSVDAEAAVEAGLLSGPAVRRGLSTTFSVPFVDTKTTR